MRRFWRWLTAPRPLKPGWYLFYREGVHPWSWSETYAYWSGEEWWQRNGVLWRRFPVRLWARVSRTPVRHP